MRSKVCFQSAKPQPPPPGPIFEPPLFSSARPCAGTARIIRTVVFTGGDYIANLPKKESGLRPDALKVVARGDEMEDKVNRVTGREQGAYL
jgi:hypothetical protein